MRIQFERKTCSRCGGCGHFSYNPSDGTVCFGCGGSGKKLSRAGVKARATYDAAMRIPAENVQVGMILRTTGITAGGRNTFTYSAKVTEIISQTDRVSQIVDGEKKPMMEFRLKSKYGEEGYCCSKESNLTRALCADLFDYVEATLEGIKGVTIEV